MGDMRGMRFVETMRFMGNMGKKNFLTHTLSSHHSHSSQLSHPSHNPHPSPSLPYLPPIPYLPQPNIISIIS